MIQSSLLFALCLGPWADAAPRPELTFGAKTNPAGAAILTTLYLNEGSAQVGPALDVYFYWYELDAKARALVYGGFLVFSGWAGWEPGWFREADDPDGPRRFMSRPLGRARVEMNLRNDLAWLYLRGTGQTKHRSFAEYDPYKDAVFDQGLELFGEFSAAIMGSPSGAAERKFWFYLEITLEAERRVGFTDRLPRGGLIIEKLSPTVSMDFDFSWSLMDNNVGGPGALVVLWWTPGAGAVSSDG